MNRPRTVRVWLALGTHQYKQCNVHIGDLRGSRPPDRDHTANGRSPSRIPVVDGSGCCACRSSPAQPLLPMPCRAVGRHPRRRASGCLVVRVLAIGPAVSAVDSPHGGNPCPIRNGQRRGDRVCARVARGSSVPLQAGCEPLPATSAHLCVAGLPSSPCRPDGLLPTNAPTLRCGVAALNFQGGGRCLPDQTLVLEPVV